MKHDLHIRGFAFGLRPLALEDAEFIVELRTDPQRSRFLHPIPPSVEAQRAYVEEYFKRDGDYYFVVERQHENSREGLVAIYNADLQKRTADWGRWILRPGSLASVESALRVYEAVFDHLHLDEVHSQTYVENEPVVSFHDRCCLTRRAVLPGYYTVDGIAIDVVEHVLTRRDWPRVRQFMEPLAKKVADRLQPTS
jgi:RimJ/RimL family protein N-acetyltransferase